MITVFLVCLFVGIIALLTSLVVGHDHDFDHDHDGPSFLNIKVVASFIMSFGAFGFLGAYQRGLSPVWASLAGVTGGIVTAVFMALSLSWLYKQQSTQHIKYEDLIGMEAIVSVYVGNVDPGEVSVQFPDGRQEKHLALASNGIQVGNRVKVVSALGSALIVQPV